MPVYCCVEGCNTIHKRDSVVSFHRIPYSSRETYEKIFKTLNNQELEGHAVRLCSKHFEPDCFKEIPGKARYLKKTALPTIFPGSGNQLRTINVIKTFVHNEENTAVHNDIDENAFEVDNIEENQSNFVDPCELKKVLARAHQKIKEQKSKLDTLYRKDKRSKQKIDLLKAQIHYLEQKCLIDNKFSQKLNNKNNDPLSMGCEYDDDEEEEDLRL